MGSGNWRRILPYAFLASLAGLAHAPILRCAVLLTNSDFALFSMLAQDFLSGHFRAFPPGANYGGLTFTALRSLWIAAAAPLFHRTIFDPWINLDFSYLFLPVIWTLTCFVLARKLYSPRTALLVGIICACGFPGWITLYGDDFYWGAMLLGAVALIWRAGLTDPLGRLTPLQLGAFGVLAGQIAYSWRNGLPFAAAFLLPMSRVEMRSWRKSYPKLRFVLLGAVIGLLPEIVFLAHNSVPEVLADGIFASTPHEIAHKLIRLPSRFVELTAGSDYDWSLVFPKSSALLLAISCAFLACDAYRREKLRPLFVSLFLTFGLYLFFGNYTGGAWRYLFPTTLAIVLSTGSLFEAIFKIKVRALSWGLLAAFFAIHLGDQWVFRSLLAEKSRVADQERVIRETVSSFKNAGVRVVRVSDFSDSNTFTFVGGREVYFLPPGRRHAPDEGYRIFENEKRAGSLLRRTGRSDEGPPKVEGQQHLARIGDLDLFVYDRGSAGIP